MPGIKHCLAMLCLSVPICTGGLCSAAPPSVGNPYPQREERLNLPPLDSLPHPLPATLSACGKDGTLPAGQVNQILSEMKNIEGSEIRYNELSAEPYGFIRGKIPVLISAPHGAQHYRRDYWKGEDEYTSSLAVVLGQLTGAHVLYARNKSPEDPNQDEPSAYKDLVKQVVQECGVRFVIDLHGSDQNRPYKVDVGILSTKGDNSSCPTYRNIIRNAFLGFQDPIFNQFFPAKGNGTITSFCRKELRIEAAQVEINARYRVLQRKPDSCMARANRDADFRAKDRDVIELISRMVKMISGIHAKIEECGAVPNPVTAAHTKDGSALPQSLSPEAKPEGR